MYHFKNTLFSRSAGQALIEALVALATILVILSAIAIAIISSVNNSDFIKKQTLAKKYAEQGMEHIRYLRNNRPGSATVPGSFFSFDPTTTYCMNDVDETDPDDDPFISGECANINIGGYFKREVRFFHNDSQCGDGGTRVTMNVYWSSNKCSSSNNFCHSSKLVSCFPSIPATLRSL
jgi:Tfp pilus assembly protein PilV